MRKIPERVGSKYRFVSLAARRCEQLQAGAAPKAEDVKFSKFTTLAMHEVLDDLLDFEDSKGLSISPHSKPKEEVAEDVAEKEVEAPEAE